jgi:flagellar biosynthesis/type III secretory pathway protein FliH
MGPRNVFALAWGLAICCCFVLGGCKTDHEAVMKKSVGKMEEMVGVLKSVQDEASSRAAAPKIKAIAKDMQDLKKEADALGEPSQAEQQRLKTAYNDRIQRASAEGAKEGLRIAMNPKLMTPELKDALNAMGNIKRQ